MPKRHLVKRRTALVRQNLTIRASLFVIFGKLHQISVQVAQKNAEMTSKAATNTSAVDSRKELSELIKRKAEISVNQFFISFVYIFGIFR